MPLLIFFLLFHPDFSHATKPTKVIYGVDHRRDLYDVQNPDYVRWARSTAALMYPENLANRENGTTQIVGPTLKVKERLCPDEAFAAQPAPAYCSGTLITSRHILTAGHCVDSDIQCLQLRVVFDFAVTRPGQILQSVPTTSLYRCAKIIYSQSDEYGADFGIFELDRDVTDRAALALGMSLHLQPRDRLVVIGYPSGVPVKVDSGGRVRNQQAATYFQGTLDTFGGSSGSGVFDPRDGKLVGVLVRGEADYVLRGQCHKAVRCLESNCRGEDINRIELVKDVFHP